MEKEARAAENAWKAVVDGRTLETVRRTSPSPRGAQQTDEATQKWFSHTKV